jgi:dsDNA-specific endonuclease/ATPase MutS2
MNEKRHENWADYLKGVTPLALVKKPGKRGKRAEKPPFAPAQAARMARLDLHGHSLEEAHRVFSRFIEEKAQNGVAEVLVITGKGRDGTSPLRRALPLWAEAPRLARHIRSLAQAPLAKGGAGAWILALKSAAPRRDLTKPRPSRQKKGA